MFWLSVIIAICVALTLVILASPPLLVVGIILAALVVINPFRAGDALRLWSIWKWVPFLGKRITAAGFAVALLLYSVPVPGLVTYVLVESIRSGNAGQPGGPTLPGAPVSSPQVERSPASPSPAPSRPPASPPPTIPPTPSVASKPASTPAPASPQTQSAPASTCSASVKFPTPGDGGDQTVSVTSNVANSSVAMVVHYKTTIHSFTFPTDSAGSGSYTFSMGRPTVGYQVDVTVTVGSAHCSTSFTPQ